MGYETNPIVRDVAHACDKDVHSVIQFHMARVQGSQAKSQVAFLAAASALGTAAGAFLALNSALGGGQTSDEEAADALWSLLKPMTVSAVPRARSQKAQGETSHA